MLHVARLLVNLPECLRAFIALSSAILRAFSRLFASGVSAEPPRSGASLPPPGRSPRPVFQDDAGGLELVTDGVGALEVAGLAGGEAFFDAGLDALRGVVAGCSRAGLQVDFRVALQQSQHAAERPEQAGLVGVTALVQVGGEFEEDGERLGGIEIVVHRLLEAGGLRHDPVDFVRAGGDAS